MSKRILWLTDIHLNFLDEMAFRAFLAEIGQRDPDIIFIGGDIGEATTVAPFLRAIAMSLECPIYLVLGNHDYYHGSIAQVREEIALLTHHFPLLTYLSRAGIIELTSSSALIGHDGWADGGYGDYFGSEIELNDYSLIRDLTGLDKSQRLQSLRVLGLEAAAHLQKWLLLALESHQRVYCLTHVPPFKESCWYEGRISGENWLPHFACKAVGDTLLSIMQNHPNQTLTVLCGHTHSGGESKILDNLIVITGGAEYGNPKIQGIINLETESQETQVIEPL